LRSTSIFSGVGISGSGCWCALSSVSNTPQNTVAMADDFNWNCYQDKYVDFENMVHAFLALSQEEQERVTDSLAFESSCKRGAIPNTLEGAKKRRDAIKKIKDGKDPFPKKPKPGMGTTPGIMPPKPPKPGIGTSPDVLTEHEQEQANKEAAPKPFSLNERDIEARLQEQEQANQKAIKDKKRQPYPDLHARQEDHRTNKAMTAMIAMDISPNEDDIK